MQQLPPPHLPYWRWQRRALHPIGCPGGAGGRDAPLLLPSGGTGGAELCGEAGVFREGQVRVASGLRLLPALDTAVPQEGTNPLFLEAHLFLQGTEFEAQGGEEAAENAGVRKC